ncbi:restriction endonuclease subunit S [Vibrio metschnikovii]|uniref:restriction endonuclease subunit S n=1 Tax=Vibrio metschnikovii TaxID=28172 RepID=UPI001C30CC0F|nr:restriction endonuclease subunit S [Vibrio metschnikovii]
MDTLAEIPKYESYKDSSVLNIGNIPQHWHVKKLKFMTSVNSNSLPENTPSNMLLEYVDIGSVSLERGIEKTEVYVFKDAPSRARRLAKTGDVVVSTVRTYLKAIAYVNAEASKYIYSTGFAVISPKEDLSSNYLGYFVKSNAFTNQVDLVAKGMSYPAINSSELSNLYLIDVPESEQYLIEKFLSLKVADIDEAVAIKEQQMTLLKERKQIVTQQAVTQGVNPNVSMKDSGVAWIGKIPEHWEVRRSKFLFTQRKEKAWKDDVQLSATQAYGVIPQEQYEELTGKRVVKIQFHLDKRKHVEKDDFVISMRSFQGGLERAWSRGCIRSSYVVLKALEEIEPAFYGYLLKLPTYIKALQQTASFIRDGQDLNFDNFSQVDLFIPPISEQIEIANYIETFNKSADETLVLLEQQIEKLKEYKTSLINSAVTGKIKITPEMAEG